MYIIHHSDVCLCIQMRKANTARQTLANTQSSQTSPPHRHTMMEQSEQQSCRQAGAGCCRRHRRRRIYFQQCARQHHHLHTRGVPAQRVLCCCCCCCSARVMFLCMYNINIHDVTNTALRNHTSTKHTHYCAGNLRHP